MKYLAIWCLLGICNLYASETKEPAKLNNESQSIFEQITNTLSANKCATECETSEDSSCNESCLIKEKGKWDSVIAKEENQKEFEDKIISQINEAKEIVLNADIKANCELECKENQNKDANCVKTCIEVNTAKELTCSLNEEGQGLNQTETKTSQANISTPLKQKVYHVGLMTMTQDNKLCDRGRGYYNCSNFPLVGIKRTMPLELPKNSLTANLPSVYRVTSVNLGVDHMRNSIEDSGNVRQLTPSQAQEEFNTPTDTPEEGYNYYSVASLYDVVKVKYLKFEYTEGVEVPFKSTTPMVQSYRLGMSAGLSAQLSYKNNTIYRDDYLYLLNSEPQNMQGHFDPIFRNSTKLATKENDSTKRNLNMNLAPIIYLNAGADCDFGTNRNLLSINGGARIPVRSKLESPSVYIQVTVPINYTEKRVIQD